MERGAVGRSAEISDNGESTVRIITSCGNVRPRPGGVLQKKCRSDERCEEEGC